MNRIKELRKELHLNQEQLAKRVGVVRTTITEYEREKINIPYDKLQKLADIFDVSVQYVTGESFLRYEADESDLEEKLCKLIDELNTPAVRFTHKNRTVNKVTRRLVRDLLIQCVSIIKAVEK